MACGSYDCASFWPLLADLLIAATVHANSLPLLTRNPDSFVGLEQMDAVHAV